MRSTTYGWNNVYDEDQIWLQWKYYGPYVRSDIISMIYIISYTSVFPVNKSLTYPLCLYVKIWWYLFMFRFAKSVTIVISRTWFNSLLKTIDLKLRYRRIGKFGFCFISIVHNETHFENWELLCSLNLVTIYQILDFWHVKKLHLS